MARGNPSVSKAVTSTLTTSQGTSSIKTTVLKARFSVNTKDDSAGGFVLKKSNLREVVSAGAMSCAAAAG